MRLHCGKNLQKRNLKVAQFGNYLYFCSVQVEALPATVNQTNNFSYIEARI